MDKRMKKLFIVVLVILAVIIGFFCFNAFSGISGTYVSETGQYTVEFEKNGDCTWLQSGSFFYGTYSKEGDNWRLEVQGSGMYQNTVFYVQKVDAKTIIVNGGTVHNATFIKK